MKKIFAILLVVAVILPLSQAFAITQNEYDEVLRQRDALYQQVIDAGLKPIVEIEKLPVATESPVKVSTEYVVTKEYRWNTSGYFFNDLVIKNTSGRNCLIEVTMYFKDKNGNVIGVKNDDKYACEDGYETYWSFGNNEEFESVEFDITMNDNRFYDCIQSKLDLKVLTTKDKAILSVKNTTERPMSFVNYFVLFLDENGKVIERGRGYLADSDYEIKPGKTQSQEQRCREPFAEVVAYAHGQFDD